MCQACMEMELYFAYLDEVAEAKRTAQQTASHWQREVTVLPQEGEATMLAPAAPDALTPTKPRFSCDTPE